LFQRLKVPTAQDMPALPVDGYRSFAKVELI
jgi:hypothetical protein